MYWNILSCRFISVHFTAVIIISFIGSKNMQWYHNRAVGFSVETYLSPVETHCMNVDYFFLDTDNQTHEFSEDAMTRLRKYNNHRSVVGWHNVKIFFWFISSRGAHFAYIIINLYRCRCFYRHGQIDDSVVHRELFCDVRRLLDRCRGMLEKIARKHHGHRYPGAVSV